MTTNDIDLIEEFKIWGGGEVHVKVKLPEKNDPYFDVINGYDTTYRIKNSDDIMELLLMVDAYKQQGLALNELTLPYVPYGRQDRVIRTGEPLSIKVFAKLINDLYPAKVNIVDPHSDVTTALIDNCHIVDHSHAVKKFIQDLPIPPSLIKTPIIIPDAGATKRVLKILDKINYTSVGNTPAYIQFLKTRTIHGDPSFRYVNNFMNLEHVIVIDDICDGGRTFIELAKELSNLGVVNKHLFVSHGIFSNGVEELKKHYQTIACLNTYHSAEGYKDLDIKVYNYEI